MCEDTHIACRYICLKSLLIGLKAVKPSTSVEPAIEFIQSGVTSKWQPSQKHRKTKYRQLRQSSSYAHNMTEESKLTGINPNTEVVAPPTEITTTEDYANDAEEAGDASAEDAADGPTGKKKKSKKAKLKKALTGGGGSKDVSSSSSNPASKLTSGQVEQLLEMNPSLKSEVAGLDKEKAADKLKKLDVADLLTGMV